ncbi:MAG: hypothetical protein AAF847_09915 [Bacteroidota bacterium]
MNKVLNPARSHSQASAAVVRKKIKNGYGLSISGRSFFTNFLNITKDEID